MKVFMVLALSLFTSSLMASEMILSCQCLDRDSYLEEPKKKGKVTGLGKTYREAYEAAQKVCAKRVYEERRSPISPMRAAVDAKLKCSEPVYRVRPTTLKGKLLNIRELIEVDPGRAKAQLEEVIKNM